MSDESEKISCDKHGESSSAFVCEHLMEDPVQRWYCNVPSEDNRWPDAWCEKCDVEFMKEGEWNENNEKKANIKLLCCECYVSLKGKSVGRLTGEQEEQWEIVVAEAQIELSEKQKKWGNDFEISNHERWDWNQENAELVFSNNGVPAVKCRIAFVGSISAKSDTWLWSWANFSLVEKIREPLIAVQNYGYEHDYPKLTIPQWQAEEVDGWEMAAIAAKVLDAEAIYRTPSERGFTFLAVFETRRVQ